MSETAIQKSNPDSLATQLDEAERAIEEVSHKCTPTALVALSALRQSVMLSKGINMLRKALTPELMTHFVMPLQNSRLGYLTDRGNAKSGPTTYSQEEVREVMIEGMLRGLRPTGNEINIISGACYAAKAGVKRLCESWPGVSCLTLTPGVPEMSAGNTALIAMRATWLQDGKPQEYYRGKTATDDTRFAVRVNSGMGPDAIVGKAERKMYSALYSRLSNGTMSLPDGDAIETVGETVHTPTPTPPAPGVEGKGRMKMRPPSEPMAQDEPGANG